MMRTTSVSPSRRAVLGALLVLLVASPGAAQREDAIPADTELRAPVSSRDEAARRSREERAKPVVYKPPRRGSPKGRMAGGARGAAALPKPLALAPDHVALTQSASPSLFWHLDGVAPETARIVFTLTLADGIEPVVERELPLPTAAGIQRIRLADHGVLLTPEVDYAWSVSLLTNDDRSADIVSEGTLRLVGSDALSGRPASARVFAEQGLWYDALEALSDALDDTPSDPELRTQRDSLLRQAGLEQALSERPQAAH